MVPQSRGRAAEGDVILKDLGFALFLRGELDLVGSLKPALHEMRISSWNCRNCEEFSSLLDQTEPQLVFTDAELPDGTWLRVMRLIEGVKLPVSVFVVGQESNPRMEYLVRECGGYGYLTPQIERAPLQAAVRSALEEVQERRGAMARAVA